MQFKAKPNSPLVVTNVKFSGPAISRSGDLILDTGAMFTSISWDLAKDLGYHPERSTRFVPIVTANGIIKVPLLKVGKVGIGNLEVRNLPVICHDIPELVEVEGLLGLSFLKYFQVMVDIPKGVFEIS